MWWFTSFPRESPDAAGAVAATLGSADGRRQVRYGGCLVPC